MLDKDWGAVAFIRHVHHEDRQRVEQTMQGAVASLLEWSAEFRVVWPDGTVHWLVAKGNTYRTTDEGQAARMLGIVMDITARKNGSASSTLRGEDSPLFLGQQSALLSQRC